MQLVYDTNGISKEVPFTLAQIQFEGVGKDSADHLRLTEEEIAIAEESTQWFRDRDAKRGI